MGIRESDAFIYVASAGGGNRAGAMLWDPCGSSSYFSGSRINNSHSQTKRFLGFEPEKYVCRETALSLAMAAYREATIDMMLDGITEKKPIGVGITASVATTEMHRGDHRFCVGIVSDAGANYFEKILVKGFGERQREADGRTVDGYAIDILSTHLGIVEDDLTMACEIVPESELREIFMKHPLFLNNGIRHEASWLADKWCNALPCTINPLHEGHKGMLTEVNELSTRPMNVYVNTVKPRHGKQPPATTTMLNRAAQVQVANIKDGTDYAVLFTDAALFVEMAKQFGPKYIIAGVDAALRLMDPQWYSTSVEDMLEDIRHAGTRFAIFGRDIEGAHGTGYMTSKDFISTHVAPLRSLFQHMFTPLSGEWHVSSTQLRNAKK